MIRLLNILVIAALVVAASYVYKIKFDATVAAQRVAKMRTEIRRERDAIATLRAEWANLDNPERVQQLAKRILTLKPLESNQFDPLDKLPERPVHLVPPGVADPIGAIIESLDDEEILTSASGAQGGR